MSLNENWKSEVRRILQEVFPDAWDEGECNDQLIPFYIHFPHIHITNSRNGEHDIYDLYIRLTFYNDGGRLQEVEGNRATYNQAEFETAYSHSHLSSAVVNNTAWGGFCMGAEEIVTDINELKSASLEGREELFEAFLFQLDIFLQWESLEGGPYKKIENISRRKNPIHIYDNHKDDAYNRFIGKHDSVNFNVQTTPPKITIDPYDEDFMDKMVPLIPEELLVRRDSVTGEFFTDGSTNSYPDTLLGFSFKGEPVIRKVKNEEEQEEEPKYYPHPEILRGVSKRLERKLTLHALTKRERNEPEADGCIIAGVMVQSV